jgi:hypothetical protein
MSRTESFHIRWRGRVTGPFSWGELERKLDGHEIGLLHDLQFNNEWKTLGEYLEIRGEFVRVTPNVPIAGPPTAADFKTAPAPTIAPGNALPWTPRRSIFVGLGVLAGFIGAHDFYAQHWIRGALLFVIAAILFRLEWGIIWPWLWALGEVIVTKVDGQGRRMSWTRRTQ